MTPATEAKADAIRTGSTHLSKLDLAMLLAMLTSANKDEREDAKKTVRDLARKGNTILVTERQATNLANRANHFEP